MRYFILACSLLISKICSIEVIIQKASETEVNVRLKQDQLTLYIDAIESYNGYGR